MTVNSRSSLKKKEGKEREFEFLLIYLFLMNINHVGRMMVFIAK